METLEFTISEVHRKKRLWQELASLSILLVFSALAIPLILGTSDIPNLLAVGAVIMVFLLLAYIAQLRFEGWFKYAYRIDNDGITQIRASGRERYGAWSDVSGVDVRSSKLWFRANGPNAKRLVVDRFIDDSPTELTKTIFYHLHRHGKTQLVNFYIDYFHAGEARQFLRTPKWRWHCYGQVFSVLLVGVGMWLHLIGQFTLTDLWLNLIFAVVLSVTALVSVTVMWRRSIKKVSEYGSEAPSE